MLLREALKAVVAVSYGGGPTTNLHRRLEAGERWIREARKSLELMSRDGDVSAVFLDYLRSLTEDLAAFAAKVKRCLPRAGETGPREYAVLSEFRQALDVKKEELSDRLEHEGVLADVYEPTKSKILGFEDEESFRDYVDPWLHQLLRKKDPKVRDLAQRLLKDPIFTPAGLASEGHRKSIVMDVVNALVREDGAIWTDRETGSKAEGRVTSAGRDLLTKLIARFYA